MSIQIPERPAELDLVDRWPDDTIWLLPAIVASVAVCAVYLGTHPYPAFGAGLFFHMAEHVSAAGYALPVTIPNYAEPVPFAYPPFMFYAVAILRDLTGLDPLTISRLLPGLVTTAYLVPFYFFVRELLGSRRQAGLAAFVLALSPPVLQWHLSAGGIVRAPAALFLITGLYTSLRLFRTGRASCLVASVALFALTILSHPMYPVFFGVSVLWMYLALDRSWEGLRNGAVVAVGGVALTAPWWGTVMARYGYDVFTNASGTQGGIVNRVLELAVALIPDLVRDLSPDLLTAARSPEVLGVRPWMIEIDAAGLLLFVGWFALIVGAGFVLVSVDELRELRTNVFLVGWLVLSFVVVPQPRFQFLVGAVLLTVVVFEFLPTIGRRLSGSVLAPGYVEVGILVLLGVGFLTVSLLYAGGALDSHAGSDSLPAFLDEADVEAMAWVEAETAPDDRFVVMGDAAEWLPMYTDRDMLVGPWGIEWRGNGAFERELRQFIEVSTCHSASCLSIEVDDAGVAPDYVYVPKGQYTVRGMETSTGPQMWQDLLESRAYSLAYENAGVMVFAVDHNLADRPAPADVGGAPRSTVASLSPVAGTTRHGRQPDDRHGFAVDRQQPERGPATASHRNRSGSPVGYGPGEVPGRGRGAGDTARIGSPTVGDPADHPTDVPLA
jgi:hypothetical protein